MRAGAASADALAAERDRRGEALLAAAESPSREKVCECGCGRVFTPQRSTRRYFSDECRDRVKLAKRRSDRGETVKRDRLRAVLGALGAEERGDQPTTRLTGEPRECRCNGKGIADHDQDGDPFCKRCGGPIVGEPRNPARAVPAGVSLRTTAPPRLPPPPGAASSFRVGKRRRISRAVKVYYGEPCKPKGEVTIRPASFFEKREVAR